MPAAPYGSWPSPITSDFLVEKVVSLSDVRVDGDEVWWSEGRPQEGGRQVVVKAAPGEPPADVLPHPYSARSRVHEYGGGAFAVYRGTLLFSNFVDQRLWRLDPGGSPRPLTSEPAAPGAVRFADGAVTGDGRWLACVRERHPGDGGGRVVNDLVALPTSGEGEPLVLAEGRDFYASPRFSSDGRLAWLCWDHPNMPWDGTELWVADADASLRITHVRRLAGGAEESISQPRWSPEDVLHWVSDRSGWWNLYADEGATGQPLAPVEAEFAQPDWVFGQSSYTFLADGRLVAAWSHDGRIRVGVVSGGRVEPVRIPFTDLSSLQGAGTRVVAIAASGRQSPAVVTIDVDSGTTEVIRPSREATVPAGAISDAQPIVFPTSGGHSAHAFYYPPRLDGFEGPTGERPPLLVRSHGGPTGAASPTLNLDIQFWTSRGFALVDVDYRGSTGYGREYRRRLDGLWGVVDVDDCVNAALHLAAEGMVDRSRLAVRGGSAGGFTTLCALIFRQEFAAGTSYYGVADLEALAADTHKFESRYLDRLVGPYPEAREVYRERSPIHFADRIRVPVILFQGLEDAVVPPRQAEALVEALRQNGIPFSYVTFEGEQHGFRRADSIRQAVEAELAFYGLVLGFVPADRLDPLPVENAGAIAPRRGP